MSKIQIVLLLGAICAGMGCQTVPKSQPSAVAKTIEIPEAPDIKIVCRWPFRSSFIFQLDSAAPSRSAIETLVVIAAELRNHELDTVELKGHTCDLGESNFNVALGLKRAEAVKAVLVSLGVAAERITTSSAGETHPAVPNTSEANRSLNRRVELDVVFRD